MSAPTESAYADPSYDDMNNADTLSPLSHLSHLSHLPFEDFDRHHADILLEANYFPHEKPSVNEKHVSHENLESNTNKNVIYNNTSYNRETTTTEKTSPVFQPVEINIPQVNNIIVDWPSFLVFCEERAFEEEYMPYLRHCSAQILEQESSFECVIRMPSDVEYNQITSIRPLLENTLREFLGKEFAKHSILGTTFSHAHFLENTLVIRYNTTVEKKRSIAQMMEEMHDHPQIILLQKELGASLLSCHDVRAKHR